MVESGVEADQFQECNIKETSTKRSPRERSSSAISGQSMNSQGRNRKSSAASLSLTDGTQIDNNGKSPTYTGQNNGLMQDGKSANTEEMNAFTPSNGENTEIKTVTPDVSRCESIISTMDDIFSELDKNEDEVHEKEEELERQRRMYRPDKNMEEESSTKDITAFGPVSRNRSGTQKQSKDFNQNVALDTGLNVAMDEDDISWGDVIDEPDKEEEKKLDVEVGEMKAPRKVMMGRGTGAGDLLSGQIPQARTSPASPGTADRSPAQSRELLFFI